MPVFNNILAGAAGQAGGAAAAGPIKSVRFNSGDSAYLNRTPSSAGNRKTWTWSAWVKRSKLGERVALFTAGSDNTEILFEPNDKLRIYFFPSGAYAGHTKTDASFRDTSAWYHIVFAIDTTQTGNDNIAKIYVNGVEQEVTHPNNWTTNGETDVNNTVAQYIGSRFGPGRLINACMADIYLIDGAQLEPTSFGAFDDNGVWQAATYSGTYGTNGFHLNFADGSDLGADNSGNGNDFTPNNLVGTVDVADVSVASATGALPIYNTTDTYGATQGTGTRTDSDASSLVLAIPFLSNQNDVHATVKGSGSNKTVSGSGASASSTKDKFYGGSFRFDGSTATPMNVADSDDFTFDGDFTVEAWVWPDATNAFQIVTSKWDVGGQEFILAIDSNGKAEFHWAPYSDGGPAIESAAGVVNAKAWNHLAAVRSSGTITLYVNGTSVGTRSNNTAATNRSTLLTIGYLQYLGGSKLAGYLQDLRIYKGAAKYTSNFNPPSDPADKLPGEDLDLLFDVPTNGTQSDTGAGGEVSGNYCTWNPLDSNSNHSLSNGNLDLGGYASAARTNGTISVSSGKWYFEVTNTDGWDYVMIGVGPAGTTGSYPGSDSTSWSFLADGNKYHNGSGTSVSPAGNSAGDIIGVALDLDNGKIYFSVNGVYVGSGDPAAGSNPAYSSVSGTLTPAIRIWNSGNSNKNISANFGQREFAFDAPSGYKALCTTNLPTPTIADGSEYFQASLWTGNGAARSITTTGMSPDFVWIKMRSGSYHNVVFDSVRGATYRLNTNLTNAEDTGAGVGVVSSFNSDGFSLDGGGGNVNQSSGSYVGWAWDAGSSTVSNTDGSITSSVRANQTAGFSIVGWSGDNTNANKTVGHGLNASPEFIILKPRTEARHWLIWHKAIDNDEAFLFTTGTAAGSRFGPDAPTSSVFGVYGGQGNRGTTDFIAYCFAPVKNYSQFGVYTGNGSADGTFVYTGFRPRYILVKCSHSTSPWSIYDTARGQNENNVLLEADASTAEQTPSNRQFDLLSNGFKNRSTSFNVNQNGGTYIYAAFAENPFQANGGLAR